MVIGSSARAEQDLIKKTQEEIRKKVEASERKISKAESQGEFDMVKHAAKTGDELEMLAQKDMPWEEVAELKYSVPEGKLYKTRGKFTQEAVDEFGNEVKIPYERVNVKDTTKFRPSGITVSSEGDEIVAEFMNEATGEVFKKYGKIPADAPDFSKMDIDGLQTWVESTRKVAFGNSSPDQDMYKDLWKIGRQKITELLPLLSEKKANQAKLYEILRILNIDESMVNKMPSHSEMVKMLKGLPGRMKVEKDYIKRNIVDEGSPIAKSLEDIGLTSDVDTILGGDIGRTSEFTEAGWLQKLGAFGSEVTGSVYGKGERAAKYLSKPIKAVGAIPVRLLDNMSPQNLNSFRNKLVQNGKGGEHFAKQLEDLSGAEGEIKDKILFSLSQSPAFRKLLGTFIKEMGMDMAEDTGMPPSQLDKLLTDYKEIQQEDSLESIEEPSRMPASIEKVRSREGFRPNVYKDSLGKDTIGYGHLITEENRRTGKIHGIDFTKGLTKEQAQIILDIDRYNAEEGLKNSFTKYDIDYNVLNDTQKDGMVDAAFQLGSDFLDKFPSMKAAIAGKKFDEAAKQALIGRTDKNPSDWIKQTPVRVKDFIQKIDTDFTAEDALDFNKYNSDDRFDFSQKEIEELQKAKDREFNQLSSGALPGTERASLDDLMGKLDALQGVSEEEKGDMQEYAMAGDMNMLQEMMDKYKGTIS